MQEHSTQKINTFSIGFEEINYNESEYARKVAERLGTNHTAWIVTPEQCLDVIQSLPDIYDEPFSDSSQIPTLVLSRLTHSKVTVALSGDGGDELFSGYTRYEWAGRLWNLIDMFPVSLRPALAKLLQLVPYHLWNVFGRFLSSLMGQSLNLHNLGARIEKAIYYFSAANQTELYDRILSHWFETNTILHTEQQFTLVDAGSAKQSNIHEYMLWHDLTHYLPDDILTKVDRASMATSLETRAPYLDHELIELVESFPSSVVQNSNNPKIILRNILKKYLPSELFERPKMGFAVPLDSWLRSELKDLMHDLLNPSLIRQQGIFDSATIEKTVQQHLSKRRNFQYQIWDLISFQLWYKRWMS